MPSSKRRRLNNRDQNDPLAEAYAGVTFTPIPSTGRPGTPHSYFGASYRVEFDNTSNTDAAPAAAPAQIVHKHVNGLVVVTAGDMASQTGTSMEWVVASTADVASQSLKQKRKVQAKMLRGQAVPGAVRPTDTLVRLITCGDDDDDDDNQGTTTTGSSSDNTIHLRCAVWGHVLERNERLTPALLRADPLLEGYLAVLLPTGPFPPPTKRTQKTRAKVPEEAPSTTVPTP